MFLLKLLPTPKDILILKEKHFESKTWIYLMLGSLAVAQLPECEQDGTGCSE